MSSPRDCATQHYPPRMRAAHATHDAGLTPPLTYRASARARRSLGARGNPCRTPNLDLVAEPTDPPPRFAVLPSPRWYACALLLVLSTVLLLFHRTCVLRPRSNPLFLCGLYRSSCPLLIVSTKANAMHDCAQLFALRSALLILAAIQSHHPPDLYSSTLIAVSAPLRTEQNHASNPHSHEHWGILLFDYMPASTWHLSAPRRLTVLLLVLRPHAKNERISETSLPSRAKPQYPTASQHLRVLSSRRQPSHILVLSVTFVASDVLDSSLSISMMPRTQFVNGASSGSFRACTVAGPRSKCCRIPVPVPRSSSQSLSSMRMPMCISRPYADIAPQTTRVRAFLFL
ncbi:hypothetical protein C8R44DRAFT_880152 [Mycena epipterygia]|nr:hypothetical protein C8R44DRAFT_880152 [Mycena epipterygia]